MRREDEREEENGRELVTGARELDLNWTNRGGGHAGQWLTLAVQVLDLLNRSETGEHAVQGIIDLVEDGTGIEEVNLHLTAEAGSGSRPLAAHPCIRSRTQETDGSERSSRDRPCISCMFGTVMSGTGDPSLPFFTERGSFWTDTRAGLLSAVSQIEPDIPLEKDGCESVAIIPLRCGAELVGILELRDSRKGYLFKELVCFLERIGSSIAVALTRARTTEALRESERRLREAQAIGEVGDWELDVETGEVKWSQEVFQLFERETGQGAPSIEESLSYYTPGDRAVLSEQISRAIETGEEFDSDYELRLRSGKRVFLRGMIRGVRDSSGRVVRLRGVVQDMTRRRKAEEGLRRAEDRYRNLVENLNEAVYVLDITGVVMYVSPAIQSVLGSSPEEVTGEPLSRFIHKEDLPKYLEDLEATMSGREVKADYRALARSGDIRWVRTSNHPIVRRGSVAGVNGVLTDITDARFAESRLRESEENYRTIFELAPDGILTVNLEGVVTSCNPAFLELYGHDPGSIIGKHFTELPAVRPEEIPRYADMFSAALRGDMPAQTEMAWESPSGAVRHADIRFRVVRKDGRVVGVQCVTRDITERKAAEQELKKNEAQYRNLVETMNDGLAVQDECGLIAYANHRFCDMLGYSRDEVIGRPLASLMDKENFEIVSEQTEQRKDGKSSSYELSWTSKDGHVVNTLTSGSPITDPEGRLIGSFGVITDITERKRAEGALRESEETLRGVFESVADGMVLLDALGSIVDVNERALDMFGHEEKSEVLGRSVFEFVVQNERAQMVREFGVIVREGKIARADCTCIRKDGSAFPAQVSAAPLKAGSGRLSGSVVAVADATERKKAEEEVRKFKTISDRAGYGVLISDLAGSITYANDSLAQMLGRSAGELIGKDISVLQHEAGEQEEGWLLSLLEKGSKLVGKEVRLGRKDGSGFPALVNATLIRNDREEPILMAATCVDLTDRKKAEEEKEKAESQLRHSQKMEALGTLAGGIAHDFNNLLTAIGGYADLALSKVSKDSAVSSYLSNIRDASSRAARLTNQLLMFSRRQVVTFHCLELNKAVLSMIKMLSRLIGEKHPIVTDLDPHLWNARGDLGHIEQVIMNVVVNARDAMPAGGEIRIKTENAQRLGAGPERVEERYVCLSIKDSGTGMDEETALRIFDPFFSTKGPGKGSGIGLAVVYGIVKRHGGWIEVETAPGKGSEFRIFFPAASGTPEEDKPETGSLEVLCGRGEKVLVIEDEERVRGFAGGVLVENGYRAFLARNAAEAEELFGREKASLDLVFSDVVLPEKSGLELVEQFLAEKPGLCVLLASGYGQDYADYEVIERRGYPFIKKPYQMLDLLKALRSVLEKKDSGGTS